MHYTSSITALSADDRVQLTVIDRYTVEMIPLGDVILWRGKFVH